MKTNGDFRISFEDSDPDHPRDQHLEVTTSSGRSIFSYRYADPHAFIQDAWLTEHYLVVEELNLQRRTVGLRAHDLPSGREIDFTAGLPATEPELDVRSGRVAFITGTRRGGMCVAEYRFQDRRAERVACARPGTILGDISVGPHRTIYSSLTGVDTKKRCKRLFTVARGTPPMEVKGEHPCLAWSGATTVRDLAWDEMDPSRPAMGDASGFVRSEGGGRVERLGMVDTDTIASCGGSFFWTAHADMTDRIDRRAPSGRVETVWTPVENVLALLPQCTDDRWLSMRTDDLGGGDEYYTHYVLDVAELDAEH